MRYLLFTTLLLLQFSLFAQNSDSLLFKQARDAYFNGNADKALDLLNSDTSLAEGNQRIAYYLNAATAYSTLRNYDKSNELFDIAYRIIEDSSKNTGSKAIAYLMNPMATQYEGESAEQILIHYYKIQNYLATGNGQAATSEVQKLGARIETVKDIYKNSNVFTGETMYHQLAGIVAEYNGNNEQALDSYLKAYELYGQYSLPNFGVDAPWQLKADIVRLSTGEEQSSWAGLFDIDPTTLTKKGNEVLVFWHNGKSPHKNSNLLNLKITAQGMDVKALDSKTGETFPVAMAAGMQAASKMLAGGTDVNLKFARYQNYEPKYDSAKIGSISIEPMENLTNVLNQSLTDRKARDINSMMGRHLAKSVLKNKAKQKMGGLVNKIPGAGLVGANKMVNKAIDNAIDNTEKADWRQWDMLPHTVSYGRIYLPEGAQNININYTANDGGKEIKTEKFTVKKGTNVLVMTSFQAQEMEEAEVPVPVVAEVASLGEAASNTTLTNSLTRTVAVAPISKTANVKEGYGSVYIVRPSFLGLAINFRVFADGEEMGKTKGKRYLKFDLPAGNHLIMSKAENESEYELEVNAGEVYYLEQKVKMGALKARNELELLSTEEGLAALEKCKPAK
jgi:hypothetical protein